MASGNVSGLKRFLLWDYPRASWQYDVMVALILGFIFFTPRGFFRDQPRASNIVQLPVEHGATVFWVEPDRGFFSPYGEDYEAFPDGFEWAGPIPDPEDERSESGGEQCQ